MRVEELQATELPRLATLVTVGVSETGLVQVLVSPLFQQIATADLNRKIVEGVTEILKSCVRPRG
jgi:hypothetical protein